MRAEGETFGPNESQTAAALRDTVPLIGAVRCGRGAARRGGIVTSHCAARSDPSSCIPGDPGGRRLPMVRFMRSVGAAGSGGGASAGMSAPSRRRAYCDLRLDAVIGFRSAYYAKSTPIHVLSSGFTRREATPPALAAGTLATTDCGLSQTMLRSIGDEIYVLFGGNVSPLHGYPWFVCTVTPLGVEDD